MSIEIKPGVGSNNSLKEAKERYARNWTEIATKLPKDISPHHEKFIRDYFRAQLRIAMGQRTKAKRILDGLDKRTGFHQFEEDNERLLAGIDHAIHGRTNRRDIKGNPVEPLF